MELAVGTPVDRYTVEGLLGEGGMAVVYRCRHNTLGTPHALKLLTLSSRTVRERLVLEGKLQASLRHPNIVTVTDIVTVNGSPGLVMEFIDGPALDELLDQQRLTVEQMDVLADGILDGVGAAHAAGLIHRDLKPGNIMLDLSSGEPVPKVMDFGLAKVVEGTALGAATRTGSTMGTPQYMSPEQVADTKNVDHRTDVFALGAVFYEMATGRRAFDGDNLLDIFRAAAEGDYVPVAELVPTLPQRMVDAIESALQPDREARAQSVAELRLVWRGAVDTVGIPSGPFDTARLRSFVSSPAPFPEEPVATWAPGRVEVVSLLSAPELAQPVRSSSPHSTDSLVSRKSLVLGGGAAAAVGSVGILAVLGVVGALGVLWWSSQPVERRVVMDEEAPPEVVAQPAEPPTEVPPTIAEVAAVPSVDPVAVPEPNTASTNHDVPDPGSDALEDEPLDEVKPEPEPAEPAALELEALGSPDAAVRLAGLERTRGQSGYDAVLVSLARSDPNEDVRREAFEVLVYNARRQRGDVAIVAPYLREVMEGDTFSIRAAARAYGEVGTDLGFLFTHLARVDGLSAQISTIKAITSIAERTNRQQEAAASLERARPTVKGRMASGALDAAIERLAGP